MANRFSLEGKVAVVTGASKGIGEAVARGLAAAGAKVVVSSRKQTAVDQVAEAIRADGGEATAIACHVGDAEAREALVARTLEAYGGVDVLVNNAATNPVFGPSLNVDAAAFRKIMEVNLEAPFELAKGVHPSMSARGGGSIVNISSIGGIRPEPGLGIYSVSKAGLVSLTKVLAREWGPSGIRVNAVCPGLIKTRFSRALWENESITREFVSHLPLGRIGEPDDVAGTVVFLASGAAAYCTGGVYMVDGGHVV